MVYERPGDALWGPISLTVVGERLKPGDQAPDFELACLNPETFLPSERVRLSELRGRVVILNVAASLDTEICSNQGRQADQIRHELPPGVELLTVTADLPYAQQRWCSVQRAAHRVVSAYRAVKEFGTAYGILLREPELLQRSLFVIDREGKIAHAEYMKELAKTPDLNAAVAIARKLVAE